MATDKEFVPTEEQQNVLNIKSGIHLVLAPPGSGKTELLASRVERAISNGFKDEDIICLTFTNRAAKGMKERIEQKYPNNSIIIGNIHNYCSAFLFQNRLIPLNTSILDEEDSDNIIEELKKQFDYDPRDSKGKSLIYNPNLLKLATYLKQSSLKFANEILQYPKSGEIPDYEKAVLVCNAYNQIKSDYSYLDFDDLLTETFAFLSKDNIEYKLSKFQWIQVDEVQDLNPIQWAIIEKIQFPNSLVVYFGDYEQAIFSFMGAKLTSLHKIEKKCKENPGNGIHNLQKNFRSPSYLLNIYVDYAKKLLQPVWKKDPTASRTELSQKGYLKIHSVQGSIQKEAAHIVENILPSFTKNSSDKTAIIVRYNITADTISDALNYAGVSHFKISGFDLFRRKSIKGLMAFLSILENDFDKLSWARIYYEFTNLNSIKESRYFIHEMYKIGLTPLDILLFKNQSSRLNEFSKNVSSGRVIIFDTETTGLNTQTDDIIQIAAVEMINGKINREFEIYLSTEKDLTESQKIHNISRDFLNHKSLPPTSGLHNFIEFIGTDSILIAHNLSFDSEILNSNLQKHLGVTLESICKQRFDTLEISKLIFPSLSSYKLGTLIEYLKLDGTNSHNALDDVRATASLVVHLNSKCDVLVQKQMDYFSKNNKSNVNNAFINKFTLLYLKILAKYNLSKSISEVINDYFEHIVDEKIIKSDDYESKEKSEIKKLINHVQYYTDHGSKLTLRQKIAKYIPEYKTFKESDLFYGKDNIVLSTVYKAKGLEFDNVIIAESTDSTYPSWASKTEDAVLEDARAFYVALSRAKKRLHVTYHNVNQWGYTQRPSRFLNSIKQHFE